MRALYEDNHLLIAVKPPMVPTQADASGDMDFLSQCKDYIRRKYGKPGNVYLGLVHRLDRPAAGVMAFARTSKAAARLARQMAEGAFEKTYLAVVHGRPEREGRYIDWLSKDAASNTVRAVAEGAGAKRAELVYRVRETRDGLSLVEIRLLTGRPHQIRVQFSSRGFPLYGDCKYGVGERDGLALYSHKIALLHPTKGERMEFSCLPEGGAFAAFLQGLREGVEG